MEKLGKGSCLTTKWLICKIFYVNLCNEKFELSKEFYRLNIIILK